MRKPSTAAWEFACSFTDTNYMTPFRREQFALRFDAAVKPLVDAYRDFPCSVCGDSFKVGKITRRFTPGDT